MSLKVLVADDATFVRDLIKRTLRHMIPDLELFEAPDGARAMSLIKMKSPDLIFSDWEMPEMSGDELLRWLRQEPKFANTPFVMITSRGDRSNVMEAVSAGVTDYLSKPFTADELTRKIAKQLQRIGYEPRGHRATQSTVVFSSLEVLTGKSATHPSPAAPAAKQAANAAAGNFKGKAFLRLPRASGELEVRELSLQAMGGTMQRPEAMPTVFDQAAVDLIGANGEAMARINAYVHSISATSPSPDCDTLRIIVRFVDQDPAKLEVIKSLLS